MTKFFAGYTARSAYTGGVGSRIRNVEAFESVLAEAVEAFDFTTANPGVRTEGQGFIRLDQAASTCSAGVGLKTTNPGDYVLREWRGDVKAFLRREHAVVAETLAVVVYQGPAFLAALDNPDTPADVAESEREAFLASGATHAVVAVIAGAGPEALSPGRLVSNLAGGNDDWAFDPSEEVQDDVAALAFEACEFIGRVNLAAREALAYSAEWSVVSD